jgi:beta propeller repeat protein
MYDSKLSFGFLIALTLFTVSAEYPHELQITKDPSSQNNPAIYGTVVVWTDYRQGNADIYGYNLDTGKEFQITTNPEDQFSPAIYGIW